MSRVWTCQRVTAGVKCGHRNPRIKRNCELCSKPRPATQRPAHMRALDVPYVQYVELNGGEHCGICRRERKPGARRLDRDHDHKGAGTPRGILCANCNRWLMPSMDVTWLRSAVAYLERAEQPTHVQAVTQLVRKAA